MAKAKSFADKMAKSTQDFTTHCPICEESITQVKRIVSEKSEKTGAYRFNQKFVGICNCGDEEARAAKQAEAASGKSEKPDVEQTEMADTEKAEKPVDEKTEKPEPGKTEEQAKKAEAAPAEEDTESKEEKKDASA